LANFNHWQWPKSSNALQFELFVANELFVWKHYLVECVASIC